MIVDLHTHTRGISPCCKSPYNEIIDDSKAAGLDGIIIANHYQKSYPRDHALTASEYVAAYEKEVALAMEYGKSVGCKVFYAIEITAERYKNVHLLVYGVPFAFLYENPEVYDLELKELYTLVKAYGGVLIQAHPYRGGTTVLDVNYLDGVEINCHPHFGPTHRDRLIAIAEENDLHVTCGGDYHATSYRPLCGMYLPDDIADSRQLAAYILSSAEKTLLVHEQGSDTPTTIKVKA